MMNCRHGNLNGGIVELSNRRMVEDGRIVESLNIGMEWGPGTNYL